MKIIIAGVGSPSRPLAGGIAEYEERARRYWALETIEVKPERAAKGKPDAQVRSAESDRLLERVPAGVDTVILTRRGKEMTSIQIAKYLQEIALHARAGAAFLIGGALGFSTRAIRNADRTLSLSPLTLPHDLARLILAEQLYRAGTIIRGEPYHKGRG